MMILMSMITKTVMMLMMMKRTTTTTATVSTWWWWGGGGRAEMDRDCKYGGVNNQKIMNKVWFLLRTTTTTMGKMMVMHKDLHDIRRVFVKKQSLIYIFGVIKVDGPVAQFQSSSLIVSFESDDDEDQEHNVCWLVGRIWIEIYLVSLVPPSPLFAPPVWSRHKPQVILRKMKKCNETENWKLYVFLHWNLTDWPISRLLELKPAFLIILLNVAIVSNLCK